MEIYGEWIYTDADECTVDKRFQLSSSHGLQSFSFVYTFRAQTRKRGFVLVVYSCGFAQGLSIYKKVECVACFLSSSHGLDQQQQHTLSLKVSIANKLVCHTHRSLWWFSLLSKESLVGHFQVIPVGHELSS
jgi:hypothetical protein